MTEQIIQWMQQLGQQHQQEMHSCEVLAPYLQGYFPDEFLRQCHFMLVDTLPMPELGGIKGLLAKHWMPSELNAISYQHGYYILRQHGDDWSLHCRELVHLVQWRHLGAQTFLEQLYQDVKAKGYEQAGLVTMADQVVSHFRQGSTIENIPTLVEQSLQAVEG
ncbi:hypothetical protein [Motilimonas eburnea]|uniref:hypothetical protein n=1 Tax=Motilimonas eburnea TaxID=1737488 RepID=UPI001E5C74E0|nr:hypothetical protein [Motilimonas eburnea]MCE2573112.1 hypothetical protein [Motilimonas eburnea]